MSGTCNVCGGPLTTFAGVTACRNPQHDKVANKSKGGQAQRGRPGKRRFNRGKGRKPEPK